MDIPHTANKTTFLVRNHHLFIAIGIGSLIGLFLHNRTDSIIPLIICITLTNTGYGVLLNQKRINPGTNQLSNPPTYLWVIALICAGLAFIQPAYLSFLIISIPLIFGYSIATTRYFRIGNHLKQSTPPSTNY